MSRLLKGDLEKYKEALKAIGYDKVDLSPLKEIEVDKMGYSPTVAEILGRDYLKDYFIIISPEQKELDLLNPAYSFSNDLLEKTYRSLGDLIEFFSKKEVLFAKMDVQPRPKFKGFRVGVEMNTPTNSVRRLMKLKKSVESVDEEKLLNDDYLKNIVEEANDLRKTYENIADMCSWNNELVHESTELFKMETEGYTAYFLPASDKKLVCVYFGKRPDFDCTAVDGSKKEKVLSLLVDLELVSIDRELAEKIMDEAEGHALVKKGMDMKESVEFQKEKKRNYFRYYNRLNECKELLGDYWYELKDVTEGRKKFDSISFGLKVKLVRRNIVDYYLDELLNKTLGKMHWGLGGHMKYDQSPTERHGGDGTG